MVQGPHSKIPSPAVNATEFVSSNPPNVSLWNRKDPDSVKEASDQSQPEDESQD